MNPNNPNQPNTAGIKIGLPNSSSKGFDVKAGIIDSNPNAPYNPNNNIKLYDSQDNTRRVAIACIIDCPFDMADKEQQNENEILNFGKQTAETTKDSINITESNTNIESTNQNNPAQPFTYEDSNITAKEIINKDNTSTLVIESNTNLLEYQGNTADTLMSGLSGVFASMATLAEKYGVDKSLKESTKGLGTKGRILASVLFQAEGASVSLTYNYGNNGKDMTKAVVSVGIGLGASYLVGLGVATLPVLPAVTIATFATVGISLFLNTQIGKNTIDWIVDKLQSFFSMFDSNPLEYELVPNPTLESKDYQSLIELLLNKNSNALDIDTLLHSFPNYLQAQNNTNSQALYPNNTLSLQESLLPPNTINSHRVGTIHFDIQVLDEYTRTPIKNAKLQLQNVNVGVEALSDSKGIAPFEIKEREYLKPFRAKLIHKNYHEYPMLDRSIIPNAIRRREKPFELRFLGKIWLYFNGSELSLYKGNQAIDYFRAYSGKALSIEEKAMEIREREYGLKAR